jgi:hypothetical protein
MRDIRRLNIILKIDLAAILLAVATLITVLLTV